MFRCPKITKLPQLAPSTAATMNNRGYNDSSKIRELICHKIASLDDHCALEDVSQALDQILDIFLELQEIRHDDTPLGDDVVTPLIVACDKAQEACIEWIVQKTKELPSLGESFGESVGPCRVWKHSITLCSEFRVCASHSIAVRNAGRKRVCDDASFSKK